MQLSKLEIERERWGENKGQYRGVITFDNEHGKISIRLTKKHCQEIFRTCADAIVDTAKSAANELTCSVLEHQATVGIEAREEGDEH